MTMVMVVIGGWRAGGGAGGDGGGRSGGAHYNRGYADNGGNDTNRVYGKGFLTGS